MAHRPARMLGAFELTRVQLVSASALLLVVVGAAGGWSSVTWGHWPAFVVASVFGVVLANLAMVAAMRRGGPRRSQLLLSQNVPITALLGYLWLGEALTGRDICGAAVTFCGVVLAMAFGRRRSAGTDAVYGSLGVVVLLGLIAAAANAVGLIALKPTLVAGTEPLAATALRTAGGALLLSVVALWPARMFDPLTERTPGLVLRAIVPGILGYVLAVTCQLYALRSLEAGVAAVLSSAAPVIILPPIWGTTGQPPGALGLCGRRAGRCGDRLDRGVIRGQAEPCFGAAWVRPRTWPAMPSSLRPPGPRRSGARVRRRRWPR